MDAAGDTLDERTAHADPIEQFRGWWADAQAAGLTEPDAMALATADARGRPSVRMVLLKGFGPEGFVFFTNARSRKGRELAANPHAALALHWGPLRRQVRVEGAVEPLPPAASDAYFATRPRGARLGAAASPQSEVIEDRGALERRVAEIDRAHPDEIPRPAHWGGFRVVPETIEFWLGRRDRLHDRLRYRRTATGWARERLAP